MKLDPAKVRLVIPFWPSLTRRRLRFCGKRNAVQLQETALVIEGDLLRFYYLGIEQLFGGVMSEWTTVTVPYSRIETVRFRSNLLVRLLVLSPFLGLAVLMGIGILSGGVSTFEVVLLLGLLAAPVSLLVFLFWRALVSAYSITFRAKDGTRTTFAFRVRSRALRREFEAALRRYRDAAGQFAPEARLP